jgi:hypothetical protein
MVWINSMRSMDKSRLSGVGVMVGVGDGVGVGVIVGVGVGEGAPGRSQNLLPVSILPAMGYTYSIQFTSLTMPSTLAAPTEI